ncbi:MAG: diaminopimelate epimerase [Rhodobacterales bacterium]|nr:diaminopimelate epimerase [Rhodobacterales bacterium]
MTGQPFIKMHGLGNDFVVVDGRADGTRLSAAQARAVADRHTGVGCDQVIILEPPRDALADLFMRIRNTDGSEAGACGNATRCVASLVMGETGADHAVIQTISGLLDAEARDGGLVAVDMGPARLDWRDIPLAEAHDTLHLPVTVGDLSDPVGVNMGNPHAVFFVNDVAAVPLEELGPRIEHHPLFPEFTNVQIAQVLDRANIRHRVWERGVGITRASGSGACATLVAAARRGLTERRATVHLEGGPLHIDWQPDGHVMMTGPVATSFTGHLDPALLDPAPLAG